LGALRFMPAVIGGPSLLLRLLVIVLVVAIAFPGAGVRAEASEMEIVLASGAIEGPGWFWVSLREGSPGWLRGELYAYDVGSPTVAAHLTDIAFGAGHTFYKEGVRAEWGASSFQGGDLDLLDPSFNRMPIGGFQNGPHWGTFQSLLWVAGNVSHWTYEIRGPGDVELVELETGDSVFLYLSHDFRGDVQVEAHTPVAGARFHGPSSLDHLFAGRWAGVFKAVSVVDNEFSSNAATKLHWTRPEGSRVNCVCVWTPFKNAFPLAEPGLHRFEMSSASVGLNSDEVFFTGVDFGNFTSASWS